MSALKHCQSASSDAAGTYTIIKRVVPTATGFCCGICRALHPTWSAASACVENCWEVQLNSQPTVAIRKGMFVLHRCRFCKREYPDPTEAVSCAKECSEAMVTEANQAASNISANAPTTAIKRMDLPFTISAKTVSPIVLHQMAKKALMPFQIHNRLIDRKFVKPLFKAVMKHAAAIATGSNQFDKLKKAQGGPGMSAPQSKQTSSSADDATVKKDPSKKFFRDGAKYVCAVCRARFFTKLEVENCWDKH